MGEFEVLADLGAFCKRPATNREPASEIRVEVNDSGTGPAISFRRWITEPRKGDSTYYVGKSRKRTLKHKSTYTGPTREGFRLQPFEAMELMEAGVQAVLASEPYTAVYEQEGAA